MLNDLRRRQTLASFDYQWGQLPAGDAMLSDPWFVANVESILARQLLGVREEWFPGRTVLDAGCGGGRWTLGFLRLGASVLAIDASARALDSTRAQMELMAPEAVAEERLATERADLLDLPASVTDRRFDLVFSFGVLHHTGDTRRALAHLAPLVRPDGLLFLYLYGAASVTPGHRLALALARAALSPLPYRAKKAVLASLLPSRDAHQAFDLFSPLVNDRHDRATVQAWLRELGFVEAVPTVDHTEIFLRACRQECSARPFLPPPSPPYWFERYRRRR